MPMPKMQPAEYRRWVRGLDGELAWKASATTLKTFDPLIVEEAFGVTGVDQHTWEQARRR